MSKTIFHTLMSLRALLVSAGPFILLAVGLLGLAYRSEERRVGKEC